MDKKDLEKGVVFFNVCSYCKKFGLIKIIGGKPICLDCLKLIIEEE